MRYFQYNDKTFSFDCNATVYFNRDTFRLGKWTNHKSQSKLRTKDHHNAMDTFYCLLPFVCMWWICMACSRQQHEKEEKPRRNRTGNSWLSSRYCPRCCTVEKHMAMHTIYKQYDYSPKMSHFFGMTVCKYWPWLKHHETPSATKMRPALSVMHAKAHFWSCEVSSATNYCSCLKISLLFQMYCQYDLQVIVTN